MSKYLSPTCLSIITYLLTIYLHIIYECWYVCLSIIFQYNFTEYILNYISIKIYFH